MTNINIGDTIIFKSATRAGCVKAKRKVNGFWAGTSNPTVAYIGWPNFVVRKREIIEVIKQVPA